MKRSKKPCSPAEWNLPLHVKHVPRISWEMADALIMPQVQDAWRHAKHCLLYPHHALMDRGEYVIGERPKEAALSDDDVRILLDFNYIETTALDEVGGLVRVFTVLERSATRRRFLAVPEDHNDAMTDPGDVKMCTVEDICRVAASYKGATHIDFSAYYTHFQLPTESRKWYCFAHRGRWYRLTTVATGQRQCPALAQALSYSIAARSVWGTTAVALAYVDNLLFAGDYTEACRALSNCLSLCELVGIKAQVEAHYSHIYTFLGVVVDHARGVVAPKPETKTKLLAAIDQGAVRVLPLRHWLALLGRLMWCARLSAINVPAAFPMLKWLRRRSASALSLEDDCALWPCLSSTLQRLRENVITAQPRSITPAQPCAEQWTMFSDASRSGWGATFINKERVHVFFGPWETAPVDSQGESTAALEALALYNGLTAWASARATGFVATSGAFTLHVLVDNTSLATKAAARIRFSRCFRLNAVLGELDALFAAAGAAAFSINWISTLRNLADAPSRFFDQQFMTRTRSVVEAASSVYESFLSS